MNKTLILVRGCPSSGKTTFANMMATINPNEIYPVHAADDYFMVDGKYMFDKTKLNQAHQSCFNRTKMAMICETPKIFVANTFTQEWEMKNYFELAKENGYEVFSIIVEKRHENENDHKVPIDKLKMMVDRFEIKLI